MDDHSKQRGFGIIEGVILIIILAGVGFGGWYIVQSQSKKEPLVQDTQNQQEPAVQSQEKPVAIKISELAVEFDKKTSVTPTYIIQEYNLNDTPHRLVKFSSEELKNKAKARGASCNDFSLLTMYVFNSRPDVARAMEGRGVTDASITKANGYVVIDERVFYIPTGIESGTGTCLNDGSNFEQEQRSLLRESLEGLRKV